MSLVDILGIIGTIGLTVFYLPQLITIWRSPRLQGFSLIAWGALLIAVVAMAIQMAMVRVWTTFTAEIVAIAVVAETIRQILRKQR